MGVRLEKQDSIGHIVLDRPPANTYDRAFMEELDGAVDEARRDDGVKAILVRSALERFFSAGADVSVFAKNDMDAQNAFVVCANEAIAKLESTPKVVVAAINGHCLAAVSRSRSAATSAWRRTGATRSDCRRSPWVCCPGPAGLSG